MKVQGREQGRAAEALASMQAATARGHYTAADAYPYLAGQTSLAALIIPAWAQEGGRDAMLQRFGDPAQRTRIIAEAEDALNARFNGAAGVYLPATQRQLVDVMREQQASAGETVIRILEKESPSAILRFGSESDLVRILQYPATAIACDCGASTETRTHPRYYGTFPRVLGHYVRETHALTWEDAVRKMTGLPASTIGMVDRGFLTPGMAADIAVFDPATVIDHATYESPALPSDGIRDVLVNGRVALRDGRPTGERGGRALIRSEHMPSRAMQDDRGRRVTFTAKSLSNLTFDVSQKPGEHTATGTLRIGDARSRFRFEAERFGVLQIANASLDGGKNRHAGWASFTARGWVQPLNVQRSATVIVDRVDPVDVGHSGILVEIEGINEKIRVPADAVRFGTPLTPQSEIFNLKSEIQTSSTSTPARSAFAAAMIFVCRCAGTSS